MSMPGALNIVLQCRDASVADSRKICDKRRKTLSGPGAAKADPTPYIWALRWSSWYPRSELMHQVMGSSPGEACFFSLSGVLKAIKLESSSANKCFDLIVNEGGEG